MREHKKQLSFLIENGGRNEPEISSPEELDGSKVDGSITMSDSSVLPSETTQIAIQKLNPSRGKKRTEKLPLSKENNDPNGGDQAFSGTPEDEARTPGSNAEKDTTAVPSDAAGYVQSAMSSGAQNSPAKIGQNFDGKPLVVAKERLTVHLPIDLIDRIKNVVYWTPGLTLARLGEAVFSRAIDELESERGTPFPKREAELRGGRPMK